MKNKADDNKKIKEPYPPEQTPTPPQVIDPSVRKERNEPAEPLSAKKRDEGTNEKRKEPGTGESKEKLLGESPTEIDDETTI